MAYPAWTNAFSPFEWTSPLPPVPPFLLKQNISLLRTLLKLTHHKMKLDNAICRWLYPLKFSILCFGNVLYSLSCYLVWAFISFCCWCTYHMQNSAISQKSSWGERGGSFPPNRCRPSKLITMWKDMDGELAYTIVMTTTKIKSHISTSTCLLWALNSPLPHLILNETLPMHCSNWKENTHTQKKNQKRWAHICLYTLLATGLFCPACALLYFLLAMRTTVNSSQVYVYRVGIRKETLLMYMSILPTQPLWANLHTIDKSKLQPPPVNPMITNSNRHVAMVTTDSTHLVCWWWKAPLVVSCVLDSVPSVHVLLLSHSCRQQLYLQTYSKQGDVINISSSIV